MAVNSNTYCSSPYSEIRINSDGSFNYCHAAYGKNLPPEDHISKVTVDEYFNNSITVNQVKQTIEGGSAVSRCSECYDTEKLNLVSFRQRRNLQHGVFTGADFHQSLEESPVWQNRAIKLKPKLYHISFSNICNMACLMCNADHSSLLATTLKQAKLIDVTTPTLRDWTQGPAWQQLCDHLLGNDEIVCLHIMGGEPFFSKRFKELLKLLDQHNHTDFHFTVVTNGSVYDEELIPILLKFKSVAIEISIEGVTNANDYIRHNSNTNEILANIKKWCSHRSSTFDVVLRSIPQALSVLHYDELLTFALSENLIIDSNALHNPSYLKANILPQHLKQIVKDKLSKFIADDISFSIHDINARDNSRVNAAIRNNASRVLAQLDEPCDDVELARTQFANYCSKYDGARNYHIKDYIPELLDFMNMCKYEPSTN
jgi:MoaA/NifB/PqqE/SkfB family radical SAM enzyme